MRVLLAAASGAIGVPLVRQLHAAGHERKPMNDLQLSLTAWRSRRCAASSPMRR
jgi:hypothetical protein